MSFRLKSLGLILTGALLGGAVALNYPAQATREVDPLPIEDLRAFSEIFGRIKNDYVEPVEDRKLITGAINGMLTSLDPHSAYLDADAFKGLQVDTQGEFGGLGIEVGMEDGFVKVISPIEDTPAYRAGIKSGDLIIKLDDTPVKGLSLNDAVKRMRGKVGTDIVLTVLRKGQNKPLTLTLTRAVIKIKSVKHKLAESGFGYVRITQFQERSAENLIDALKDLQKQNKGALKGLILDLRNDPGGLLNTAVGVAGTFLQPNDLVVYTDGRTEDAKMRLTNTREDYLRGNEGDFMRSLPAWARTVPMVVLVNGGSASASEIVAGALQDHKRAVIMGTQTFGKGSVQTIIPLNNGTAIKLTTSRYYTPNGRSIQAKGIEPDIVVEEGKISGSENGPRSEVREADLDHHLVGEGKAGGKPDGKADKSDLKLKPDSKDGQNDDKSDSKGGDKDGAVADLRPEDRMASPEDLQFSQALTLLKGLSLLRP